MESNDLAHENLDQFLITRINLRTVKHFPQLHKIQSMHGVLYLSIGMTVNTKQYFF